MTFNDTFDGDNAALLESIGALLRLAQTNALVPPVPGMPLQLMECAAARITALEAENFKLAAGVCHWVTGNEHGNAYCGDTGKLL